MTAADDLRTIRETAAFTAGHDMARDLINDGVLPWHLVMPNRFATRLASTLQRTANLTPAECVTWKLAFLGGFEDYRLSALHNARSRHPLGTRADGSAYES